MTTQICINILYGASSVTEEDRQRAECAALEVLDRAGVSSETAFAEFQRQWAEFDDYENMTGHAALWVEAEKAADVALTQGWRDPSGSSCSIS
jgi:hypothetical protein